MSKEMEVLKLQQQAIDSIIKLLGLYPTRKNEDFPKELDARNIPSYRFNKKGKIINFKDASNKRGDLIEAMLKWIKENPPPKKEMVI